MAKISTYTPAVPLTGVELIPGVQSGDTVALTPAQLVTFTFSGFAANTFPARSSSGALAAKPITDFALSLLDDADAATARATLGAGTVTSVAVANATGITWTGSPVTGSGTLTPTLDATLAALAGQNWAANAVPIGSGADTLTQVSFAANTFPARASTGNLVAKTITDFGLSLVDDANAATARTTLGIPTLAATTYTPTLTSVANVDSTVASSCQYSQVGNVVTVSGHFQVDTTAAASTGTTIGISLPVPSDLTINGNLGGAANSDNGEFARVYPDVTNNRASVTFASLGTGNRNFWFCFQYLVQ